MRQTRIEQKLQQLNLPLPPASPTGGVYPPVVKQGNLIYVSGQAPVQPDGTLISGKIGEDMDAEAGQQAARQLRLTVLAALKAHFGPLEGIRRLVKLFRMVNCPPALNNILCD